MIFPIELVLPMDGRDAGEVLVEGDVPEFVANAWVRAGLARRLEQKKGKR